MTRAGHQTDLIHAPPGHIRHDADNLRIDRRPAEVTDLLGKQKQDYGSARDHHQRRKDQFHLAGEPPFASHEPFLDLRRGRNTYPVGLGPDST
jgi:hypothetical protein